MVDPSCVTAMFALAVVAGYVLTSYLLLKFPTLLHEKKKQKFKAVHISHRGGAGECLENTIGAFKHACEKGTDMLELDCHITKDSQVVVSHDDNLLRATGHNVLVSQTLYEELPLLRGNVKLDFSYDRYGPADGEDKKIPLLSNVFTAFPNVPINIDIKIDNNELITQISKLVRDYKREDITVWGNRQNCICTKCLHENPSLSTFFSMRRVMIIMALYYTGLLPFAPLPESFFEVVMPSVFLKDGRFHTAFSPRFKILLKAADYLLMNRSLFQHLKARGIQIYLWVLNEEDDWHRAFQLGATGVMTDFPTHLTEFLNAHPHYKAQ